MASSMSELPACGAAQRKPESDDASALVIDVAAATAVANTHVDVVVRRDGHREDDCRRVLACVRPSWRADDELRFTYFDKGITNTLIGVRRADDADEQDVVLLRVYGANTDIVINRADEKRNMLLLHAAGLAPPLYASFANGLAYGYVNGAPVDRDQVRGLAIAKLIAREVARFHSISLDWLDTDAAAAAATAASAHALPPLFMKMRSFLDHYPSVEAAAIAPGAAIEHKESLLIAANLPSRDVLSVELSLLEDVVGRGCAPHCHLVFCHNDLLLNNIIYNRTTGRVAFIDYEYGGPNPDAYDIGNHFCEYAGVDDPDFSLYPDRDFQLAWLREYLVNRRLRSDGGVRDPSPCELQNLYAAVNKYALCAHFFWGLWSIVQAQHSLIDFDYASYGAQRFAEYFARKDEFLTL